MVEQFAFTDVTVNAKIDKAMVKPSWASVPPDWQVKQGAAGDVVTARHRLDRDASVPPGFIKIMEGFRKLRGKREPVAHLVFSDGLVAVSVFVEPLTAARRRRSAMHSARAALNVYSVKQRRLSSSPCWARRRRRPFARSRSRSRAVRKPRSRPHIRARHARRSPSRNACHARSLARPASLALRCSSRFAAACSSRRPSAQGRAAAPARLHRSLREAGPGRRVDRRHAEGRGAAAACPSCPRTIRSTSSSAASARSRRARARARVRGAVGRLGLHRRQPTATSSPTRTSSTAPTRCRVRLTDKREFKAKVIGADKRTDIALLKIEAKDLPKVDDRRPRQAARSANGSSRSASRSASRTR